MAMITLALPSGEHAVVSPFWLRDSCTCAECRHPSGQRLLDPATLPANLAAADIAISGDRLCVTWMPGAHVSEYSLAELFAAPAPTDGPYLWDASAATNVPTADHAAIAGDDTASRRARLTWLRGLDAMGCALLHGVPVSNGAVAGAAQLFGYVRETNYGRWFDVRSVVDPTNLANSALGLAPHTDNPYRDPVPTMQLLHCLESTAAGGENMLVDGWRVAAEVRADLPLGFAALTRIPVTFRYADADTDLFTTAPLIELDTSDAVRSVRFNPRSMHPPQTFGAHSATDIAAWYDAYVLFARLVSDPRFQIRLRLDPGDLFVVDNRRVLHGRAAFLPATGSRHLQGCYADIDGLRSSIAVLARQLGATS
jgi:gamma-butyrobetaine dioxygenase